MAWSGGVFQRVRNWVNDKNAGIKIRADFHDSEDDNIAAGMTSIVNGEITWTGIFKFLSGGANAPGLTFGVDTDTGLYRSGADALGLATGGIGALTVDANQDTTLNGNLTLSSNMYFADQVSGGTADALTVGVDATLAAYATDQLIMFKPSLDNTGAATIDVNSIGTKKIRKFVGGSDVDVAAGDVSKGGLAIFSYDAAADSATGAWIVRAFDASGLLPLSGGTMTGAIFKPAVENVAIAHTASGGLTLDTALGSVFDVIASGNITSITVTNALASLDNTVKINATNWGAQTVTWEESDTTAIQTPGKVAPTLTAAGLDLLELSVASDGTHTLVIRGLDSGAIV